MRCVSPAKVFIPSQLTRNHGTALIALSLFFAMAHTEGALGRADNVCRCLLLAGGLHGDAQDKHTHTHGHTHLLRREDALRRSGWLYCNHSFFLSCGTFCKTAAARMFVCLKKNNMRMRQVSEAPVWHHLRCFIQDSERLFCPTGMRIHSDLRSRFEVCFLHGKPFVKVNKDKDLSG